MKPGELMREIAQGNFHRGGIRCLRLFDVEKAFFESLVDEARRLVEGSLPSDVRDPSHRTHWTRPFGRAVQFSLLNRSGSFDDTSSDHDGSVLGKSFHHGHLYPTFAEFIASFPHAINMRLNGLGPDSGLSPHEEHVLWRSGNEYTVRVRFHLPLLTNDRAEMLLEDSCYRFEEGSIYYFNNGCIHSATNFGDEFRYHLVWDMRLTEKAFCLMFSESESGDARFLRRVTGRDREVPAHRRENVEEYQISGMGEILFRRLRLHRLGLKPHRFENAYRSLDYLRFRLLGKVRLADVR